MRGDLLAYARSIADSPEEAEDLVSDALERAARAEGRPRDPDALRPWMFRVIRNLNVDELRKRRIHLACARTRPNCVKPGSAC